MCSILSQCLPRLPFAAAVIRLSLPVVVVSDDDGGGWLVGLLFSVMMSPSPCDSNGRTTAKHIMIIMLDARGFPPLDIMHACTYSVCI